MVQLNYLMGLRGEGRCRGGVKGREGGGVRGGGGLRGWEGTHTVPVLPVSSVERSE